MYEEYKYLKNGSHNVGEKALQVRAIVHTEEFLLQSKCPTIMIACVRHTRSFCRTAPRTGCGDCVAATRGTFSSRHREIGRWKY